ncbi:hypothetical protein ACM44_12865 [Chryseobacterium koreense CCUG 49689]|uniref:Uncharacterized protein n=2 Tax=Chryseobacterium koreense TaxID=232216 RepID=A0A0J7IWK0_9FLAO|nr:hypothetical protein ACM44_12865 [Chryseobacterium koreense CCUG 49689]
MVCQLIGSYEAVLEMAILNNRGITTPLAIGEEIKASAVIRQDAVNIFRKKQPATALEQHSDDAMEELEGIGYWIINKNFRVS